MMDKPHLVRLDYRLLAHDFVLEAPRRRSLHRANGVGRLLPFLSAVFFALAVIWVLGHGGFERVTEMFSLMRP
jgi:hypothetical protein